jgi:hypothetical protein
MSKFDDGVAIGLLLGSKSGSGGLPPDPEPTIQCPFSYRSEESSEFTDKVRTGNPISNYGSSYNVEDI